MDAQEVIQAIMTGAVDDKFTEVTDALRLRRRQIRDQLAMVNKVTLGPGVRVRLHGLSPKYLNGLLGTVQPQPANRAKDIKVQLDDGQYTGRFSKNINVPASALQEVTGVMA